MNKYCLALLASAAVCSVFGNTLSDETLLRFAPMPNAPVIDGKISTDEWRFASSTYGGISTKTGLMTRRQNDFRLGYDAKNLYVAILNYDKYKITDLFTGKAVERAELELPRYGYALWKIEKL